MTGTSVKVFLITLDPARSFFYSEDPDEDDDRGTSPDRPGLAGWFERTSRRAKSSFKHPKGRLARKSKQVWDWLQRRMHPDEPLLAALRSASAVAIHHHATLESDEARASWSAYLRRRRLRHWLWLVFNVLLSPVAILLTPLPGPNVIGYWFAYRAVRHLLILSGIRRALSGQVEASFHPVAGLDATVGPADREWLARTAARYKLRGLHDFVARLAPEPAAAATATDATRGTQPPCDC